MYVQFFEKHSTRELQLLSVFYFTCFQNLLRQLYFVFKKITSYTLYYLYLNKWLNKNRFNGFANGRCIYIFI